MKDLTIQQIAIRVPDQSVVAPNIINFFNVANKFDKDNLLMDGEFLGNDEKDVSLELRFNFEIIPKFEFELITSSAAYHWHNEITDKHGNISFLSHLGAYCSLEKLHDVKNSMNSSGIKCLQHSISKNHSSIRSDGSIRSYEDAIFDTENLFGFRLKLSAPSKFDEKRNET